MKHKVAIVRGPGLSKWEMQIYEPLTQWFNLVGIGSSKPVNDISNIQFPVKQLMCPSQYIAFLPKVIPLMFRIFGDTQWLMGFDKAILGCDLIHAVELNNGYSYQAIEAKKKGLVKAVTITVYENIPFLFDEFPRRKRLKKEVIANTDHFFAANSKALEALLAEGITDEKISLIPQSVDTNIFHPPVKQDSDTLQKLRRKFKLNQNDLVVLGVGRIVWEKGWYDVIRSAAKLKRMSIENVKFLVVGEGSEKNSLQDFINREKLQKSVILVGAISYKNIPSFFQLADIFVHISIPTRVWNEQFGGVLIEAMAAGLPIVGTLNGGIKETVGDGGGFFVQPQDFSDLANATQNLCKDEELRDKMGKRNRKAAIEQYDVRVVAQKIKKIWDRILINA